MTGYDDIIVGGGSAGIALAVRLTDDPSRRVLLLEAGADVTGPSAPDVLSDQMRFSSQLTEWGIDASFVPGGSLNYPQGRKLGGGSAVNGAFAVRGLPDDYERWARAGGDDWSWPHMLRVLTRLETDLDFPGGVHGADGPIPVVRWQPDELLPMQRSFLAAVGDRGIPWVDDANAPDASGVGAIPMNRKDGLRMSTALTYLPPVRQRPNLTIRTGVEVPRVLLEGTRAVGVEIAGPQGVEQVRADRVVLCAGALQSPSLLMRSGIGPAGHLAEHGVACVLDLPGVGENLMDHQGTAVFLLPRTDLAPADDRVCQLGARWTSSLGLAADDMWLSMWSVWELAEFPDLQAAVGGLPAISAVIAGVHDPLSRGTVRLRSSDPSMRPKVDFNMLSHPDDMARMVEALQLAIDLAVSEPFAEAYSGIGLLDPAARDDREVLEGYLRNTVGGWYHASGTCRMGADPGDGAVVDGGLRVHGISGLHVADASIMPTVVRAPTNLSSIAIGERAAELLR
jgi:choline dehydrogenase